MEGTSSWTCTSVLDRHSSFTTIANQNILTKSMNTNLIFKNKKIKWGEKERNISPKEKRKLSVQKIFSSLSQSAQHTLKYTEILVAYGSVLTTVLQIYFIFTIGFKPSTT